MKTALIIFALAGVLLAGCHGQTQPMARPDNTTHMRTHDRSEQAPEPFGPVFESEENLWGHVQFD